MTSIAPFSPQALEPIGAGIDSEVVGAVDTHPQVISERVAFFQESRKAKELLRGVLREVRAAEKGVLLTGSNRPRKAKTCALGLLFRDEQHLPKTKHRNLTVGGKEMVMIVSPGIVPPTHLKARIVAGAAVEDHLRERLARIFLDVKEEGMFERSYTLALQEIFRRFVESVILEA